uniref:Mitochondrial chaperone BCS1 n=1 Tax=Plectus sambesii TaxID=2011161 RepID=A0A914XDC1_9BILA
MAKIHEYLSSLTDNPYFGAGAGLAGLGIGLSVLRKSSIIANAVIRRNCFISLEITNSDPAYPWLLNYINRHSRRQTRHLTVNTFVRQGESGKTDTAFRFLPGQGTHYFFYQGFPVLVERQRENQSIQKDGFRTPFETVTLRTFGFDATFLQRMLQKATDEELSHAETGMVIYHAVGPEWRRFGPPRRKRPLDSIVLDAGISDKIFNDLREFLNSSKWYTDRGVPYRRGYLLYGPPGCGKSSFISGIASQLGYSVCMVSLSERTLDDDRLNHLLNTAPPNSIVLLEDVDAAFHSREDHPSLKAAYEGMTRVTLSGLLNAIDGVACAEERILFMTTNYVERLDPALIRPGRIDVKEYFGNCTDYMIGQMFARFYRDEQQQLATEELTQEFVAAVRRLSCDVSAAQIQGHLLKNKFDPLSAIHNASDIVAKS